MRPCLNQLPGFCVKTLNSIKQEYLLTDLLPFHGRNSCSLSHETLLGRCKKSDTFVRHKILLFHWLPLKVN